MESSAGFRNAAARIFAGTGVLSEKPCDGDSAARAAFARSGCFEELLMKIDLKKMMLLLFYPVEFLLIGKIIIPRIEFFIGTIIIFVLSMVLFVRHSFKRIVIKRLFIYIMSIGLISFLSTFIFANHRISIVQQLLWLKNIYTYAFVFIFVVCSLVVNLPAYGILIILDKYTIKAKE